MVTPGYFDYSAVKGRQVNAGWADADAVPAIRDGGIGGGAVILTLSAQCGARPPRARRFRRGPSEARVSGRRGGLPARSGAPGFERVDRIPRPAGAKRPLLRSVVWNAHPANRYTAERTDVSLVAVWIPGMCVASRPLRRARNGRPVRGAVPGKARPDDI